MCWSSCSAAEKLAPPEHKMPAQPCLNNSNSALIATTMLFSSLLACVSSSANVTDDSCINDSPVVGVVSQFGSRAPGNLSFVAKVYVEWLASAGARVVPIPADTPMEDLKLIAKHLDGAVFPGGTSSLSPSSAYMKTVKHMVDIAVQLNNEGQYFPLWGTCLGFQAMAIALAGNNSVRTKGFNSFNLASTTTFASPLPTGARLLRVLTPDVRKQMAQNKLVYNNHQYAITNSTLAANPKLSNAIDVIAYNTDRAGEQYVAIYEAKMYPFYATQFHPEAVAVGENHSRVPSSNQAKSIAASMAEFFVEEASCSGRSNSTQFKPSMRVDSVSQFAEKSLQVPAPTTIYLVPTWKQVQSIFIPSTKSQRRMLKTVAPAA